MLRTFRSLTCLAAFAWLIFDTSRLFAFCLEPKLRVDDEYFVSELVFTGEIIKDEKIGLTPDGFYEGDELTWRIARVFRGSIRTEETVHIYSGNDSGRFPFEARVGRKFLIFAFPYASRKGEFAVDSCGNSIPLSKAVHTIAELQQLPNRHGGLLYGEMYDGDEGVRITAVGQRGTYSTVSSPGGKFAIHTPPGHYSVVAVKQAHIYGDMDLAYKHAKDVSVPEGGSAGLAFREQDK